MRVLYEQIHSALVDLKVREIRLQDFLEFRLYQRNEHHHLLSFVSAVNHLPSLHLPDPCKVAGVLRNFQYLSSYQAGWR